MSTGSSVLTLEQYLQTGNLDPQTALKLALAATERANAERATVEARVHAQLTEAKEMADVHFGPQGIQADNAAALWRIAKLFAMSSLLPEHFKGNQANCFIGLQLAQRMRIDPFALMQKLYVVHGRPGVESQLAIGMLNTSGKIKGTVRYRFDGEKDDYGCRAIVVSTDDGEVIEGPKITWKLVKAEGWDKDKKGYPSKWSTMPEQMFRYRAAMFLIRAHWPEVLLGLQTEDEIRDIAPPASQATASLPDKGLDDLTARLQQRANGLPAEATNGNGSQAAAKDDESFAPDDERTPESEIDPEEGKTVALPDGLIEAIGTCVTQEEVNNVAASAVEAYGIKGAAAIAAVGEACEQQRAIIRKKKSQPKQQTIDA